MNRTTRLIPVRRWAGALALLPGVAVLVAAATASAGEADLDILPTGIDSANPLEWRPYLLIGLVLIILVLSKLLNRVVFEPLVQVLEERERRIEGARHRAAELARDADGLLERYESAVRETRAGAGVERRQRIDEARGRYQEAIAAARQSAEAEVGRARQEVASAVSAARTSLEQEARSLAREMAERLLGRSVA